MKTYTLRSGDIIKKWYLVDAKNLILGRAATVIASTLRGKHKPNYSPHLNCGDPVVVINAKHICLTGNKLQKKEYFRHTGYPGGIKRRTAEEIINGKFPERLLRLAILRMIPKGPLGRQQMRLLKIYADNEHPHEAQKLEVLDIAGMNRKNCISNDSSV